MRTLGLTLILALALCTTTSAADTYTVDNGHSSVMFRIKHKNVSYTYGRFNTMSGSWTLDDTNPKNSKVELVIDAKSIDTNSPKRDGHLRSPDFFSVKQFAKITFKSKTVKKTAKDTYSVTGDLTLHGVTKSVTIKMTKVGEATDPKAGKLSGCEAVFTIKRSDYGMSYGMGAIGDEVKLWVSVEGVKK